MVLTGEDLVSMFSVTHVILALGAYVVLRFAYQIVYYRFFHPLSVFPGPFWGSVTRLWIAWHNLRETEVATVYALTKRYGMIYQVSAAAYPSSLCVYGLQDPSYGSPQRSFLSVTPRNCPTSTTGMQTKRVTISQGRSERPNHFSTFVLTRPMRRFASTLRVLYVSSCMSTPAKPELITQIV